ncbi:MAG TPA: hypothetical protein VIG99_06350 [Myxococcaceae bacterium]
MEPAHLRLDVALDGSRAFAVHDTACPELGPICAVRPEPPQQHHTVLWLWEARALAEYGLVPGWALNAVLPFRLVQTRTTYTDLNGAPLVLDYENIHHRNETLAGIGDPQLWIHHGVNVNGFALSQRLGVSLPLGRTQPDPEVLGALGLPHQHLQFGTGTVDPLVALEASRDIGGVGIAAFVHGQAPLYANGRGYQAGTRLLGGLQAQRTLGPVSLRLGATLVHEFPERWNGLVPLDDGNQGRTDLFVGAGATVPLSGDWSISVDVRGRAWGHVVGAQLELPLVAEVSFGRLWHFEEAEDEHETDEEVGGDEAGDVRDVVAAGEAVPLVPEQGRWTVLDFWAPWCKACGRVTAELRGIAAMDRRVAVRRVNIVDFDSPIAKQELPGVSELPYLRVVGPDGRIRMEQSGTPDELLGRLKELLREPGPRGAASASLAGSRVRPGGAEPRASHPLGQVTGAGEVAGRIDEALQIRSHLAAGRVPLLEISLERLPHDAFEGFRFPVRDEFAQRRSKPGDVHAGMLVHPISIRRHSPVHDLHATVPADDDAARIQVPMNDVPCVSVLKRFTGTEDDLRAQ